MRIRTVLLMASLLAVALPRPGRAGEAPALPAREHFRVFLLIGQSNMAGRGAVQPEDKMPHPRVLMLTKEGRWAPAVAPLHFDKPQVAGVGPGLTFGETVAEAMPGETIGLVPCAVGGTGIEQWKKGGELYQNALGRAKAAAKDGVLAGILWHQGESDLGKEAGYAEKAARLFADLRRDMDAADVPVVVGTLGDWREDNGPMSDVIRRLPQTIRLCGVADARGLKHKGDHLHFDSESARELGRRYALAWLGLAKAGKPPADAGAAR